MARVKFGDIVKDVKNNVDRNNNPYPHYIAGDHMDSEDLTLHRKGCFATDDVGPAFVRIFKKGQILYGSRRTYLKKVAVADFDGITANTTFVLESKDSKVFCQELLPFIMLSNSFTDWSIKKSKGSTNPYVLFSDLADFEFDLPPLPEQKVLAEKLWAAYRLKESYKKMIEATDEMVKSQFIEMFGEPQKYEVTTVDSVCSSIVRGPFGSALKVSYFVPQSSDTIKVYEQKNAIQNNEALGYSYISKSKYSELKRFSCGPGDILMSCSGTIGCMIQLSENAVPGIINQALCKFTLNNKILSEYFLFYMRHSVDQMETKGSAMKNIGSVKYIKAMPLVLPDMSIQEQFVMILRQADKSKFELRKSIEAIDKVIKSLINNVNV